MRSPAPAWRRALGIRDYQLFLTAQLVSSSGGWTQRIAQAWLVLELTDSPIALGTLTTLQFLPILLLSLVAGALADRFPKRRSLLILQAVGVAQALTMAGLVLVGQAQLWQVFALALVQGVAVALEQPIRQAYPVELVGKGFIGNAVAIGSTAHNSARILGPALGGAVVAAFGLTGAFVTNALCYGLVLAVLAFIRAPSRSVPQDGGRPWEQIAEGLRFAARDATLRGTLALLVVLATFGLNYSTILPLLARYELDLGASGYGILSAALGGGAVIGSLVVARIGYSSPIRQVTAGAAYVLILGAVAFSPGLIVTLGLLAGLGAAGVAFTTTANTTIQLNSPEHMRGRMMGLYTLLLMGMTPPGATATGWLADAFGIQRCLLVEAAICLVGVAVAFPYLRERAAPYRHSHS